MDWTSILRAGEEPTARRRPKVKPLPQPTTALPGSPEKQAVLEARRRRGEQLWHPLDPRLETADQLGLARRSERLRNGRDSDEETVLDRGGHRDLRSPTHDPALPPDHRAVPPD